MRRTRDYSRAATYTLNVDNQRIRSWTDTAGVTHTNHYRGTSDNPSWTDEGDGTSTRNISGLSGLAAIAGIGSDIVWKISDIQGSIVAATSSGLGLDTTSKADEYGNIQNGGPVGTDRYGWLGTEQRAADNPGGIIRMGVRLYNPATGRFLSTDPIASGSANRYDYGDQDPANRSDPSGKFTHVRVNWSDWWTKVTFHLDHAYSDILVQSLWVFAALAWVVVPEAAPIVDVVLAAAWIYLNTEVNDFHRCIWVSTRLWGNVHYGWYTGGFCR